MRGPRPARAAVLAAVLLLLAAACGKKGALRPPLRLVPQAAESLRAFQRGAAVVLEWTDPESYNDGSPLTGLAAVEIWEAAPGGAFPDSARKVRSFGPAELDRLKAGADPASRARAFTFQPASAGPRLYALRVIDARRGRASDFTPPVALSGATVPLPPSDLKAETAEDRILLRWTPPAANVDGSTPAAVGGYAVFRSEADKPARRLNEHPLAAPLFEDRDFAFGRAYRYAVRAVAAADPAAESEDAPALVVRPRDIFAPAVPAGLTATAGGSVITLLWDPGREADLAGYRVWRRTGPTGEWKLLTAAPVAGNAYTDAEPVKGARCEYAVSAVDAAGNESPRCAPVGETVRGGGA